jgi:hypothetical protein
MKITIRELQSLPAPVPAIVHSLEQALYQVTVVVDGEERLLIDNDGRVFRRRNLTAVREALQVLPITQLSLRHQSAYDEMIGQPMREGVNTLEVPLGQQIYVPLTRH